VDAGGGAPFGEDAGVVVVAVGDDGIESVEEGAAFFDEFADLGGGTDVGDLVGGLVLGVVADGGEVALEDHEEVASAVEIVGAWQGGGDGVE
jgi:hypothetical protein